MTDKAAPDSSTKTLPMWQQQTRKAQAAFLDYCRMGPGRSLRALAERYIKQAAGSGQAGITPPTTKESTLFTWSLRFDWQNGVKAYDAAQSAKADADTDARRARVIDDELADFEDQLSRWREVAETAKKHRVRSETTTTGPDGQPMKVITAALEVDDWLKLTRWRHEIAAGLRRAVGLPEKIIAQEMSGPKGGPIEQVGTTFDLSKFSLDELRELLTLLQE